LYVAFSCRRTDSEYVEIPHPKISTVLTGTPDQVLSLMPDSQNGLFSRFIFYKMGRQKKWRDVFSSTGDIGLDEYYDELGTVFITYYRLLLTQSNGIRFSLTPEQKAQFHEFFSIEYDKYVFLQKDGLEASLFKLGLICFRLSMIFTIIRALENDSLQATLQCEQRDFEIALSLIKVLLQHTEEVFLYLPKKDLILPRGKNDKELFLDALPKEFITKEYKIIAINCSISESSAERWIKEFVKKGWIHKQKHGYYLNNLKKEA